VARSSESLLLTCRDPKLCTGLQPAEHEQLITLLNRVAAEQGLTEGVHPGPAGPDPDDC
jgi:hypothetical protein